LKFLDLKESSSSTINGNSGLSLDLSLYVLTTELLLELLLEPVFDDSKLE